MDLKKAGTFSTEVSELTRPPDPNFYFGKFTLVKYLYKSPRIDIEGLSWKHSLYKTKQIKTKYKYP